MQTVYDSLLNAEDTRLEDALNESTMLSNAETNTDEEEAAAYRCHQFPESLAWLLFDMESRRRWKKAELLLSLNSKAPRTAARQKLDDFRQKYAGMTMEQALQLGNNGGKDRRPSCKGIGRFRSLWCNKSHISGHGGGGQEILGIMKTTSGEDHHCKQSQP